MRRMVMNATMERPNVIRAARLAGTLALVLLSALGLWALVATVTRGHEVLATTQHVPWGLWVAGYIFFLGLSAGSFLLSTLVYVFGVKRLEPVGPLALVQALGCLVLGGFLIIMDLGHPERIHKVLSSMQPRSVMAWMGVFYNFYLAIVMVELYLALRPRLAARAGSSRLFRALALGSQRTDEASVSRDRRWLKILGVLGIPVAIVVHGGVGSIFAVAKARPGWFSGLFPIVFLVSALASGGALLTFLVAATSRLPRPRKDGLVRLLARMSLGILSFDLLLLTSEVLVTLYGNVPHESTAWKLTLLGPFWWVFWLGQLGVGFFVPVILAVLPLARDRMPVLGLQGLLMVVGIWSSRLNLVIPPQIPPVFEGLPAAYHHERWALGYSPTPLEWGVLLAALVAGAWLFILARKFLPLEDSGPTGRAIGGEEALTARSPSALIALPRETETP
ncbi:MAG: polysulfide reductase NrfD [Deltaproteobacteria bacterium]|nr:polysulfide reductase NrfD [Deltaproteobacteria bacterium]